MSVLGPNDPRALTGKALEEAREYTEAFNRDVLGFKPRSKKAKAADKKKLDAILKLIEDK
jgi:hypothetical protein